MSNNPYQSPLDPLNNDSFSNQPSPELRSKIQAPATALLVYGIFSGFLAFLGVVSSGLHMAGMNPLTKNQAQEMERMQQQMGGDQAEFFEQWQKISNLTSGPIGVVTNGIVVIVGVLTVLAAKRMKQFEGYTMSMVVSILALIPCTSGCCIAGIPIGIWSIVVLMDKNIKAVFRN